MKINFKYNVSHIIVIIFACLQSITLLADVKRSNFELNIIDNKLVASEGEHFSWFYNGSRIDCIDGPVLVVTDPGLYTVEIVDKNGNFKKIDAMLGIKDDGSLHKIYIIGDSTVCNYNASAYPQTGWGQVLKYFFDEKEIVIDNRAIGGRSSRSFYEEGRWKSVAGLLQSGDYVFIQFGHNDRDFSKAERYTDTANYKKYLKLYVEESRAKGAIPVLISPMVMNAYTGNTMRNVFTEGANDYRGSMKQVADMLKVPFIDLNIKSYNLFRELGQQYVTRYIFHTYVAGEYPNYPNGINDGTHFQENGAIEMARLVIDGIKELNTEGNLKLLNQSLLPLFDVTINQDISNAGLITRSAKYPAGVNVTAKVIPNNGYNFYHWKNNNNTVVSTDNIYQFRMNNASTVVTGVYNPNITSVNYENIATGSITCFPNPFTENFTLTSAGPFEYYIYNTLGDLIESRKANSNSTIGENLVEGIYHLKILKENEITSFTIIKK